MSQSPRATRRPWRAGVFGNFQEENKKFCWVFWLHKSWMVTKLCDGYNPADGYKIGCGSLIAFSSNSPTQVFGDVLRWMSRWIAVAQTSLKQGCTKNFISTYFKPDVTSNAHHFSDTITLKFQQMWLKHDKLRPRNGGFLIILFSLWMWWHSGSMSAWKEKYAPVNEHTWLMEKIPAKPSGIIKPIHTVVSCSAGNQCIHPWKLTSHWKLPMFNRKYIFKWWMFHCHLIFRGGGGGYSNKNHGITLYGFIVMDQIW